MSQCPLHFKDDPTAHATVDWFLSQLRDNDSERKRFIDSLTEERSILSEDFCKGLNTARFIDCLRWEVEQDEELFKQIEYIANELCKDEKWNKFPNLCVLLLSMARDYLKEKEAVKKTSLYKVVEHIYEGFFEKKDVSLALEAGIQLSHFQEVEWQQAFNKYKVQYHKDLSELRQRYYFSDDSATFSRRARERDEWKRRARERDESNHPSPSDSDFPNPLYLNLPVVVRGSEAIDIANDFVKNLRGGSSNKEFILQNEQFIGKLAKEFRILQWDIMHRDLIQESQTDGLLSFYPITKSYKFEGTLGTKLLHDFIEGARSVERNFIPTEAEIRSNPRPQYTRPQDNSGSTFAIENSRYLQDRLRAYQKSFKHILSQSTILHPSIYDDLIRSFSNKHKTVVLIEDGELSFFSLLWLLRRAIRQPDVSIEDLKSGKKAVRFCPGDGLSDECSLFEFAEEFGLIIPLSNDNQDRDLFLTDRWRSLITWVKRLNLALPPYTDEEQWHPQHLPVKDLEYDEKEKKFVNALWKFLASEDLKELDTPSSDPIRWETFVEKFRVLVGKLESLIKVASPDDSEDTEELNDDFRKLRDDFKDKVLSRCCRVGFIPLEHLFRAYFPCELHLLVQALNWEESELGIPGLAPISMGFSTIAGRVEPILVNDSPDDFNQWREPYHTLFSILGADITLPVVQQASEQIGIQAGKKSQKQYFAHQTSRLLNAVWADENRNRLNFESNFSLWMAKTHVTDIWGGFSINTKQKIYEDEEFNSFSEKIGVDWEALDETQIVRELVYLGLHGGIDRSLDSTGDVIKYVQEQIWTKLNPSRDEPKKVKEILDNVLESLSFRLPESPPPEWVNTRAFSLCFYHGVRQAAYHALETFVMTDNNKANPKNPCLRIKWDNQCVWIYNRGEVDKEIHLAPDFKAMDREFFKLFDEKTFDKKTNEKFKTEGPKPVEIDDDIWQDDFIWQLMIRKEKS